MLPLDTSVCVWSRKEAASGWGNYNFPTHVKCFSLFLKKVYHLPQTPALEIHLQAAFLFAPRGLQSSFTKPRGCVSGFPWVCLQDRVWLSL